MIGRLALAMLLAAGSAAAEPTRVTWVLGGLMSGPYRLSADLAAGVLEEARPPAGVSGDGAGLNAWSLPVTGRHPLLPAQRQEIAALAARLYQPGAFRCPGLPSPGMIDALGALEIEQDGQARRSDGPVPCLTPDGDALVRALTCALPSRCP